jgi:NTE family protein
MTEGHALVFGGGGVAGIAWMTGLLAGLAEAGQDVTGADLIVGTSAGSTVAAQVGSGLSLDDLFARQTDPALQAREISVELDMGKLAAGDHRRPPVHRRRHPIQRQRRPGIRLR